MGGDNDDGAPSQAAIPLIAATLEEMPRDAKGMAVFEVPSAEDRQDIDAPAGIEQHWLINPDPHRPSPQQEAFIRALDWPAGRVQTCIAGEQSVIKALRDYLYNERKIPRSDTYISGYWKIGMIEDEHQAFKRAELP